MRNRRTDTRRMRHGRTIGQKNGAGNRTGDVSVKVVMGDGQIVTGWTPVNLPARQKTVEIEEPVSIMDGVETYPRLDWACADSFGVKTSEGDYEEFDRDLDPVWDIDGDQIRAIRGKWACRSNAAPILDAAEIVRCHMRKW